MNLTIKSLIILTIILFISTVSTAQARLTIENQSMRSMTVKVMKGYKGKGSLYEKITIDAYSSETIYFSESGYYFTKTKAVLNGKTPIFRRGQAFKVTNDDTGYSVLTLTFTIKESKIPQVTGGQSISQQEFEQN